MNEEELLNELVSLREDIARILAGRVNRLQRLGPDAVGLDELENADVAWRLAMVEATEARLRLRRIGSLR